RRREGSSPRLNLKTIRWLRVGLLPDIISPSHPTAVDDQRVAIQIIARSRRKKHSGTGKIARFTPAAGRNSLKYLAVTRFIRSQRRSVGRYHITGGDRVDVHIRFSPFVCKGFREPRNPGFRCRIGGNCNTALKREQ